ncbi:transforming growth factor beta activator LRRC32-like [Brienomyrus brachyistius]|uniref:transforming growth factor beta activator LRRC32-like n=1 Tax=Brienomyrus brachyistius TaxID=42636 RepID=UPI0020B1ACFE|nr:transforming growth factor beta activator LRRC32-like [Brienomyrus brachyistius]
MIGSTLIGLLVFQWPLSSYLANVSLQPQKNCQKSSFKKLSCWNQNLSSIPADLNPRLHQLDLSNNIIREIGVVNLRFLRNLDISQNEVHVIHEGAFKNLMELHTLNLGRNFLSHNSYDNSKSFRYLYRLNTLDLSLNNLDEKDVELYLTDALYLEYLSLSGNVLTKLTSEIFTGSQNLRSIIAENNFISEIEKGTFESLTRLAELNLARNNLVTICDFKLSQLKKLNLSRNALQFFITQKTENIFQLEMLDLSYNNLLLFPLLPNRNNLKYLNLKNNKVDVLENQLPFLETLFSYHKISNLYDGGLESVENIYSALKETPLVDLDLSENQFSSFPMEICSYLVSLKSLNLSGNCLTNISDAEIKDYEEEEGQPRQRCPSLQSLDLQNNQISHFSPYFLKALPNIEQLILKKNYVKPCSTRNQTGEFTSIQTNLIDDSHCVSFRRLRTLKYLDLKENGIKLLSQYTFEHTPLVTLDLDGNEEMILEKGALDGLQNTLQSLSLGRNRMTSLDLSVKCLKALKKLNVADNSLDVLPEAIACSPLKELDLRNNNFTNLQESVIRKVSIYLHTIYISGNVFNCCSVVWVKLLSETNVKIPDLNNTLCLIRQNVSVLPDFLSSDSLSKQCSLEVSIEVGITNLVNIILFVFCFTFTLMIVFIVGRCALNSSVPFRNNKIVSFQSGNDNQCSAGVAKISIFETVK